MGVAPRHDIPSIIEFDRWRPLGSPGGTYSVSLRSVGPGEQFLESGDGFRVHIHYMYVVPGSRSAIRCMK